MGRPWNGDGSRRASAKGHLAKTQTVETMLSTTRLAVRATITQGGDGKPETFDNELTGRYEAIIQQQRLNWTTHHRLLRVLGKGGQGIVFLTERRGADQFTLPIAIKIFSPARFRSAREYDEAMARMARVASYVAQIQHDNLLYVHNFVDRRRIRGMVMEWIDGYDIRRLLTNRMLEAIEPRVSPVRWEYLNRVLVTAGPVHPRFKPGVAVAIVRECLTALAALHRHGVVHGDIKPSNIMLKVTGNAKIVDIGSAFRLEDPPPVYTCTPAYAAPEVLEGQPATPLSDLASLGYVLIELLAGRPLFADLDNLRDLLEARRRLPQQLHDIVPHEVAVNDLLMKFCCGMIAPDPMRRFASAEAAELLKDAGAAAFHRQLVMSDMASEYNNEIRLWLEELKSLEDDTRERGTP